MALSSTRPGISCDLGGRGFGHLRQGAGTGWAVVIATCCGHHRKEGASALYARVLVPTVTLVSQNPAEILRGGEVPFGRVILRLDGVGWLLA